MPDNKQQRTPVKLLKIGEAADLMSISRVTLWRLMNRHEIPFVMISKRCRRISSAAIDAYIARLEEEAG